MRSLALLGLSRAFAGVACAAPLMAMAQGITCEDVAAGLREPVALVAVPNHAHALLVLERRGRVWFWEAGHRHLVMDLRNHVRAQGMEQGLLGAALDPAFPRRAWLYLHFTDRRGDTAVARVRMDPQALRADASSLERLLAVRQPYANHNGGHLAFGPDGWLYIGLGDGGSAGDPHGFAQNPQALLGKMLRLHVRRWERAWRPKVLTRPVPGMLEIWGVGLRNPWRYDFDPHTGDLYIADVGQDRWEEVNLVRWPLPAQANFGWPYFEGRHPYRAHAPRGARFVMPIAEYSHAQGCAIIGGVVHRGGGLGPNWEGAFLFGDFCSGRVWALQAPRSGPTRMHLLARMPFAISAFGRDASGWIYVADFANGRICRLRPVAHP